MKTRATLSFLLSIFVILLLAQPGTLDPTFGTGGYVTNAVGQGNTFNIDVIAMPNGQILALSEVFNATADIALTRYNTDGTKDMSFGVGGTLVIDVNAGSQDFPTTMVLQPDGKILVNGNSDEDLLIMRLNSDGTFDTTFDTDGIVTMDVIPGEADYAGGIVLRPSGEIVSVSTNDGGFGNGYGIVMQFTSSGTLDPSFGTGGMLQIDHGVNSITEWLYRVDIAPSGDVFVVGSTGQISGTDQVFVYRISPAGALDPAFDSNGYRLLPIGTEADHPEAVQVLPNGQILVSGTTESSGDDHLFLAKLNTNGSYDGSFGTGGVRIFSSISSSNALDLLADANGKTLVVGYYYNGTGTSMLMTRLNADGSFDTSFGTGGLATTVVGSPTGFESGISIALAPDGNYIVAGRSGNDFTFFVVEVILKYRSGNSVSIIENTMTEVQVYPNPSAGMFHISGPRTSGFAALHLLDLNGRLVAELSADHNGQIELPPSLEAGTYLLSHADRSSMLPVPIVLVR